MLIPWSTRPLVFSVIPVSVVVVNYPCYLHTELLHVAFFDTILSLLASHLHEAFLCGYLNLLTRVIDETDEFAMKVYSFKSSIERPSVV